MPRPIAAALVFVSSAAVLVLEILAARLLAPYVGVTLEVYTSIIGVILAGIAVGSWWGGRAADRVDPRTMIGPLIVAGGILALVTIPLVDGLGAGLRGAGATTTVVLTFAGFFAPAAVLTAVTPAIVKIQLESLDETGRVVGRLSAIGTAGAIFGTFVTGFVLVAALPTRPVIRIVGVGLIVLGVVVGLWLQRARTNVAATTLGLLLAGAISFAAAHPCDHESAYYCARIEQVGEDQYVLWLDTLRHSHVDLADPSHLEFAYTGWFGDAITSFAPDRRPLDVLHVGGGALTMPRWLRVVHPGSTSTVLELDALLVDLAVDELGFEPGPDVTILTGDARTTLDLVAPGSHDVVIGDAFGGVAVPWHLATREFTQALHERLRPGGIYVMNVLDHGPKDFLRAQVATVSDVFTHVAVISRPGAFERPHAEVGGNHVVVASDAPFDLTTTYTVIDGADLDQFTGDAAVLTDDFAPVDQLLTPLP